MKKIPVWACLLVAACGETTTEPPVVVPLVLTTAALADGHIGQAYSKDLEASGGTTPYVFSIKDGVLQAGLAISGNKLSGTPTEAGKRTLTLSVKDAKSVEATKSIDLYIAPDALTVSTSSLSEGTELAMYSGQLEANGGIAPYKWTISDGDLPEGVTLAEDGEISGEPTTAGGSMFTVQVTDAEMKTTTRALMLTIRPLLPMITTTTLTRALLQTNYGEAIMVSSGHAPYMFTISMGTLPRGVFLDNAGTLAGRPLQTGVFRFTVKVTDARMRTDQAELALVVLAPLAITTRALPSAILNMPYSAQLVATGGLAPYQWFIVGALPPGLTFMNGLISGTATMQGTFPITVRVQDDTGGVRSAMFNLVVDDVIVLTSTQATPFPPVCSTAAPPTCVPWQNSVCTSTTVSYQTLAIDVPNSFAIASVTARVAVSYADSGRSYNTGNAVNNRNTRLKLVLVAPDGRFAILCGNSAGHRQEAGCNGSNGVTETFPGTENPETPFSIFTGMNAQGQWRLQAVVAWPTVDAGGACQQAGSINEFELRFDSDPSAENYTVITGFTRNNLIRVPWVRISGGNQVPDNNQIQLTATTYSVGPNGIREAGQGDDVVVPTTPVWSGSSLPPGTTVTPDGLVTGGPETGDATLDVDVGAGNIIRRSLQVIPPDWNRLIRAH